MDRRPQWLAGPIAYKTADTGMYPDRIIQVCKWEFIGGTASGEIRRWHLCFSIEKRTFTANTLHVSTWERLHAADMANLYRPISILRHFLPKGSITVAMKAMLKPEDIAEVTALSIRGGKSSA